MHSTAVPATGMTAAVAAAAIQPRVTLAVHARPHLSEASHLSQDLQRKAHQTVSHATGHALQSAAAPSSPSAGPFTAAPITGQHPAYGGACTVCGALHFLNCSEASISALQHVLAMISEHQRLDYESSGPPDPRFAIDYLFTRGPGRMLGVLLAVDPQGQQHTLKAFSGQITKCWHIPGELVEGVMITAVATRKGSWVLLCNAYGRVLCVGCSLLVSQQNLQLTLNCVHAACSKHHTRYVCMPALLPPKLCRLGGTRGWDHQ
jgi:hypothetical protein